MRIFPSPAVASVAVFDQSPVFSSTVSYFKRVGGALLPHSKKQGYVVLRYNMKLSRIFVKPPRYFVKLAPIKVIVSCKNVKLSHYNVKIITEKRDRFFSRVAAIRFRTTKLGRNG